ncbi:hypothetical protein EIP91_002242 [Steccherinum ochraceum]|uniref:Expansin-like EG45 domain-containing protein n=1 Tax=Steccherinum ochraceum TaxID=92696 RepID=A0A4R0RPN1_9APHY|nr:hypothetical protein EIP91_002242 [Steccherinum ochraceum]
MDTILNKHRGLLLLSLMGIIHVVVAVSGVTTFNDFTTQTGVACAGFQATNMQGGVVFSAAMSDLSPLWVGAKCEAACPDEEQCGKCFNITCTGSLDGEITGSCSGRAIKVKIVDACPASHPANFCKIPAFGGNINPREACEASGVNAFDIATTARTRLSSFQGNLNIDIEPTSC